MAADDTPFLSRWARRKAAARDGAALPEPASQPAPTAVAPPEPAPAGMETVAPLAPEVPPPPTLADVALLSRESDFTPFVARDVMPEVRNAALKKLFTDPHFNVMDGLDTYIDDYGKPDPLPASWLRQMVQSQLLGLFDDEPEPVKNDSAPPLTAEPPPAEPDAHEDPDLQLQPNDDAGRAGSAPGAGQDTGRPD
jgi:hypothetical protein